MEKTMEKTKDTNQQYQRSFIVVFWDKLTKALTYISILNIIVFIWFKKYNLREHLEKETNAEFVIKHLNRIYLFTEAWVVAHTILAILFSIIVYYCNNQIGSVFTFIIMAYAIIRIFEIIVYQVRVILFDGIGKKPVLKSIRRSILLLIHNLIEIIFWFSTITISLVVIYPNDLINKLPPWSDFIKSSVLYITTFGDDLTKICASSPRFLNELLFWEIIVGFIMIIISFARFLSLLPTPEFIDEKNER